MAARPDDASTDRPVLRLSRVYAVAPEKVWRAWTDPEALTRWFGPTDTERVAFAHMDVQVGGQYHIRFYTKDGGDHDVSGVYQVVEPNRRLQFTWAWKSTPDRISLVNVELTPVDGGTRLDFLHERFFDRQARDNHHRGWTGTFARLDAFLSFPPP